MLQAYYEFKKSYILICTVLRIICATLTDSHHLLSGYPVLLLFGVVYVDMIDELRHYTLGMRLRYVDGSIIDLPG